MLDNLAKPARPARRFLSPKNSGLVLTVILLSQLMVVLDGTVVNIALHDMKSALHFSDAGLSWVVNAYTLTFGGLLLLGARAGDLLGRRAVYLGGIALFTLASLLGGLAQNSGELLAARAVQGVGAAFAAPSALALLMVMFPEAKARTRAIGLYTAVSIGGAAVGLLAGGMLSEWASWRWVLYVNVPIGVVLLVLAWPTLVETARKKGRFDLAGALTSTAGMTALVYGFVHAGDHGWANAETIGSFVIGVVLLAGFVLVESRAEEPITPLRLFADRNRAASYVARLLLVAGMMGMFFFLTQFLRGVLGYSDLKTGFAFLPLTAMVFASSQFSARKLVGRFGQKPVVASGLVFSTVGMLALAQLDENSSYWALVVPLILFGLGNGTAFVPLTTLAIDGVDPADAGAASGLVNVMQQVGGALGLSVLVTIFSAVSSSESKHAGATAQHVFVTAADRSILVAAAMVFLAWVISLVVIRTRRTPQDDLDGLDAELEVALAEA